MYQFISCIKIKPGVTVDDFRKSLAQFTEHMMAEDLVGHAVKQLGVLRMFARQRNFAHRLDGLNQLGAEVFIDAFLKDKPLGVNAGLPRVAKAAADSGFDS